MSKNNKYELILELMKKKQIPYYILMLQNGESKNIVYDFNSNRFLFCSIKCFKDENNNIYMKDITKKISKKTAIMLIEKSANNEIITIQDYCAKLPAYYNPNDIKCNNTEISKDTNITEEDNEEVINEENIDNVKFSEGDFSKLSEVAFNCRNDINMWKI